MNSRYSKRADDDASQAESHFRHDCLSSPRKRQKLQADNPRKGLKRHPVFCLNVTLPNSQVDLAVEPSKKVVLLQVRSSLLTTETSTHGEICVERIVDRKAIVQVRPNAADPRWISDEQWKGRSRPGAGAPSFPVRKSATDLPVASSCRGTCRQVGSVEVSVSGRKASVDRSDHGQTNCCRFKNRQHAAFDTFFG